MPIDIDCFEHSDALREPPTSDRIIRFLRTNADRAYTRSEIADAIDASPETVGTNLTRLKDRGLVRHREPYWASADDRESAAVTGRASAPSGHDLDPERVEETATERAETTAGPHREAASTFFQRIRDRLGDDIETAYLFGSVAQDTAVADSDVDVLVVIASHADYATVDDRLLDLAYDVQLEYGVRIEVHSLRASEFAARSERGEPFVRTVVEEGETK